MAKAKRVFQIAKELDVASKAIVEKCRAEEVPGIVNHMSTVKVGLEATINEWFSSAASGAVAATAVETAEKVDLTKAREGVRRRNTTAVEVAETTTAEAVDATTTAAMASR